MTAITRVRARVLGRSARRSPPARSQALRPRRGPDRRRGRRAPAAPRAHVRPADARVGRRPARRDDKHALHVALTQLAEQDPLINLRQDDVQELYVSLYGEVQKEVIQATLVAEFGVDVEFEETTPIYIERPDRHRQRRRDPGRGGNPFLATVGCRIEPARPARESFPTRSTCGRSRCTSSRPSRSSARHRSNHGARDARAGTPRLAGHRLEGDDDGLRLCVTRSRRDTAADFRKLIPLVLHERAAGGRYRGMRADPTSSGSKGRRTRWQSASRCSRSSVPIRGRRRCRAPHSRSKGRSQPRACTSCRGSCAR